jgi:integrase
LNSKPVRKRVGANLLTARLVDAIREDGRYSDGLGLMLYVRGGRKGWVLRVQRNGRRQDMGLGPFPDVSLAKARELATDARRAIREGRDLVSERKRAAGIPSFREAMVQFIAKEAPTWRGGMEGITAFQFPRMIDRFAERLAKRRVDEIAERDILAVVLPVWTQKPESGQKLFNRIRGVMLFAKASGWCQRSIDWEEIRAGLPKGKHDRVHHASMAPAALSELVKELQAKASPSAACLLFAILTAARSGEARGATWGEIDFERALWTVPAVRMKAKRPHEVPLSPEALAVLKAAHFVRTDEGLIFPGGKPGKPKPGRPAREVKPLSDVALSKLLRSAGHAATVHGFRSTFRTWAADVAHAPREIAEACLAHAPEGGMVERAYLRTAMVERRRGLMAEWGRFATGQAAKSVSELADAA